MKNMNVKLPVGFTVNGEYTRDVQLLRSNAASEEVSTRKLGEKPYTWIAYVISMHVAKIGSIEVAEKVRKTYLETGEVIIPEVVKNMPIADANTLLLEIHRKSWNNLVPEQKIVCRQCNKTLTLDVDLDNITLPEKAISYVDENVTFEGITVDLEFPLVFNDLIKKFTKDDLNKDMLEYMDVEFNRLVLSVPTLRNCIKHEVHSSRTLEMWRRIGLDLITNIQKVEDTGAISYEFPLIRAVSLGLNFFMLMDGVDLKKFRHSLIEELPTMPFYYEVECPCDMKKSIPIAMEATNFFSE